LWLENAVENPARIESAPDGNGDGVPDIRRAAGAKFGGLVDRSAVSGLTSLSVLRTTSSRNWKDDINEPGRLEKGIDMIKRFVPRFSPFSDYQYQISTPMHLIAGVLWLLNESDAPAMRDPRARSR
jgi:hypothetical protein